MDSYQQTINFELNSTILILAAAVLVAVVAVAPHRVASRPSCAARHSHVRTKATKP